MRRVIYCAAAAAVLLALPGRGQAQGHEIVVPANTTGTLICQTGDTLLLGGPDALSDFYTCALSADRQAVPGQQQRSNPNYPYYGFRWTASAAGTHRLSIDYTLENRSVTNGRRLLVVAQDAAPAVLGTLPARFYGAASGHDLPVTVQLAPDFHASKVDFFLDGQGVGSVAAAPYGFALPLGGVLAGPHAAFIEATNGSGDVYVSPIQTVMVTNGNAPGEPDPQGTSSKTASAAVGGPQAHAAAKPKKSAHPPKRRRG